MSEVGFIIGLSVFSLAGAGWMAYEREWKWAAVSLFNALVFFGLAFLFVWAVTGE